MSSFVAIRRSRAASTTPIKEIYRPTNRHIVMGKKSRVIGGAVGRRTILQLSPPGLRSGNTGEREEAPSGSDGNF